MNMPASYHDIQTGIVALLESARTSAVRSVNTLMTTTYWEIGRRIVESEQGDEERAGYGEALVRRLAEDLTQRFGRGFGWRNLMQMRAFHLAWPAGEKVQTVSAQSDLSTMAGRFPLPMVGLCPTAFRPERVRPHLLRNGGSSLRLVRAPA